MKAKIKETESVFEPIVLEITIESEEDLCDLWHRFNSCSTRFTESPEIKHPVRSNSVGSTAVWTEINDLAKAKGLKR